MKRSPLKRSDKPLKRSPFVRKHSRLKNASTKRRKRNAEVRDFRQSFVLEVGACELCEVPGTCLDIHEISGGAFRSASLDQRYAILALCRGCHQHIETEPKLWSVARQIALLKLRREADFDLAAINKLLIRQVDEEEVEMGFIALTQPGRAEANWRRSAWRKRA